MLIHDEEHRYPTSEHANTGVEGIVFIPSSGKTFKIVDSADAKWRCGDAFTPRAILHIVFDCLLLTCQKSSGTPALAHSSLTTKYRLKLQYLSRFIAALVAPTTPPSPDGTKCNTSRFGNKTKANTP